MQTSSSSSSVPRRALLGAVAAAPTLALLGTAPAAMAEAQPLGLPRPPAGGLPQAQIFEPKTPFDRSFYADRTWFVWSSQIPEPYPGFAGAVYFPAFRDPNREHTAEWFRENHPTWVIYQADRVTPAYTYLYDWGGYCNVDVSNPEVREFYFDTYIQPWIDKGYTMIGLDNVGWANARYERQGR